MSPSPIKKAMIPPEGEAVELKQSLSEWKEIVETCAAFATARGGRIFVGSTPSGKIHGVHVGKGTLEDLANKIANNTSPRLVPSISTRTQDDKTIAVIEVRENSTKPVYAFDRAFRRSGRTNQRLSPSEASELYLESRGLTWDETTVKDAGLRDVDSKAIQHFLALAKAERRWDVGSSTPAPKVLRQLGLIRNGKLTVAGLLLFGKNPQQFMPQAALRCARFKGDDTVDFLDMKVIEAGLMEQVEEAVSFVKRHINMAAEITDLERKDRWEYPLDAVREAIVNAVCHRDYAGTGNVQVRIFDHGLEVWNPGSLPSGLSVADLRRSHESKPRNKLVARIFFLIRYIEQFGTGTRRMIQDCLAAGLPEPDFESQKDSFRVAFGKTILVEERFGHLGLSQRQLKVMSHLVKEGRLTRQEYQRLTGSTVATAKRDLSEMVRKGVLAIKGATRKLWYELAPLDSAQNEPKMSRK